MADSGIGFARPVLWTPDRVSTPEYESSPTFTPDGLEMYYVAADSGFSRFRILVSRCVAGGWSAGARPTFAAAAPVIEADPHVSWDGRRMYFVSARHDERNEDFDIYVSKRRTDGSWGEPSRLPAPVNSAASELLPRTDMEGRLYFGSARPGGAGQSDIYVAEERAGGDWRVRNVGAPVSTAGNEYEAEVSRDGRSLVVVADRGERSHLYRYRLVDGEWRETGGVQARRDVFQVGPLLSPDGRRLIFAQSHPSRSGEMFLVDLEPKPDRGWPVRCGA